MSIETNRVIFSDNGTLSDITIAQNDPVAGSSLIDMVAAQDAIFVGSVLPFNHRYIQVSSANNVASVLSIALWDGTQFTPAVDVKDLTSSAGVTLTQSGTISFTKQKNKNWTRADASTVTGITSLNIYDLYWAKITVSVNLLNTTAISFVGHRFCDENKLKSYYPDLGISLTKDKYESGKTNWNEQLIAATDEIIKRLMSSYALDDRIISGDQVYDYEVYSLACVHKTAHIIFNGFGEAYEDEAEKASKAFEEAMKVGPPKLDLNQSGTLDRSEMYKSTSVVRR